VKQIKKLHFSTRAIYRLTDRKWGGVLSILASTFKNFGETNASESAAGIAYYALFSIFPLLIFVVTFIGSFLQEASVQQQILEFAATFLPASQDLIRGNIEQVLLLRGPLQIVGAIGLLWSATAVFNVLAHGINRAWHTAQQRNFLHGRLVALAMIASLTGLLMLWFISTTVFNVLGLLEIPLWGEYTVHETFVGQIISRLIPAFLIFLTFLSLYRWVPNTKVRWREAAWGAGVATIGWEISKEGFTWYLTSGLAAYQLVYGSLGAVIAMMLWLYLNGVIVLFGAHLSAAIALHTRLRKGAEETKQKKL
jgi:membrane protein